MAVVWLAGAEMTDLLGGRLLCVGIAFGGQELRHRLDREIATLHQPLVVLLDQQRAGEADHRLVVGEDADDVGAAADLLVDALKRIASTAHPERPP